MIGHNVRYRPFYLNRTTPQSMKHSLGFIELPAWGLELKQHSDKAHGMHANRIWEARDILP